MRWTLSGVELHSKTKNTWSCSKRGARPGGPETGVAPAGRAVLHEQRGPKAQSEGEAKSS
jgi:hypothetical protein